MDVFELSVDYGAEELGALARLLDAQDAPGLAAPEPGPMSAETRRAVRAAAWRGLVARRAVLVDPGPPPSFAVAEPHAALLAPLIAPERALSLERWTPDGFARRTLYLRGDAAVEQQPLAGLIYRHTLLPRATAAGRLLRAAAIEERVAAAGEPLISTLAALTAAERDGDTPPLIYAALAVIHARAGERALLWVDGGELGLWRGSGPGAEPHGVPTATVRLEPATAGELRAALIAIAG